jgi:addiction module HigA family antidote
LNLSLSEAALQLGVSRQTLHAIMSGRSAVKAEMALRFGKFCGNGPGLWMQMQQAFDLWEAQNNLNDELDCIPAHTTARNYPLSRNEGRPLHCGRLARR